MTLFPLSSSAEPWTTTPASEKPQNSLQAWFWYKEALKATEGAKKAKPTINMTQTALLRYAIPGWGGPTPLGERVIPSEADKGFDFLEKQVSLLQFRTCQAVVELEFEKRKTDGRTQSRYRFYMKKLSEWLESQSSWWNASQANTVEEKKLYKFCRQNDGKIPLLEVRLSNARKTKAFALGTRDELYITSTLEGQLQQFKQSLVKGELGDKLREVTANRHVTEVKRILGWF